MREIAFNQGFPLSFPDRPVRYTPPRLHATLDPGLYRAHGHGLPCVSPSHDLPVCAHGILSIARTDLSPMVIKPPTGPRPVTRLGSQALHHRIIVHEVKFFKAHPLAPNDQVVSTPLPDTVMSVVVHAGRQFNPRHPPFRFVAAGLSRHFRLVAAGSPLERKR